MATDRYSDDHKIVVGGGSGTLTVDATLDAANISSADDINIESTDGDINLTTNNRDINLTTNNGVVSIDGIDIYRDSLLSNHIEYPFEVYWHCDRAINRWYFDKNTNHQFYDGNTLEFRDFSISSKDFNVSSQEDIYISAGSGSSGTGSVTISANSTSQPRILLSENSDSIQTFSTNTSINADYVLNLSSDGAVNINSPSVRISGSNESGPVAKITNTGRLAGVGTYQTDILELIFDPSDAPSKADEFNNWILFKNGSDTKGSIEGYQSSIAGPPSYTNKVFSPFAASIGSANSDYFGAGLYNYLGAGPTTLGTTASDWDGYVIYKSGNQDYGEWIEIGDFEEWGIDKSSINTKNQVIGFEEGTLVFVRGSRFWRYGPGTPMIITNRPIIIGNVNYKDSSKLGEILSFIGQVPAIVMGPVKDGDFLIPKEGANYCVAIDREKITFSQYKECIGTAWSNLEEEILGFVNCAVRIK